MLINQIHFVYIHIIKINYFEKSLTIFKIFNNDYYYLFCNLYVKFKELKYSNSVQVINSNVIALNNILKINVQKNLNNFK
jgi:hypothetical protein